jgi:hypothetical protein
MALACRENGHHAISPTSNLVLIPAFHCLKHKPRKEYVNINNNAIECSAAQLNMELLAFNSF